MLELATGRIFRPMGDSEDTDKGIIAERLDRLFATMTPEGRPYSLREVADGINAQAGRTVVSFQYLSLLRSGAKRKPSHEKLKAIADWFGVGSAYFDDDEVARRTDEELRGLALMRDAGVRSVAFRAAGLGQKNLDIVVSLLETLRSAEGLPPADAGDHPDESASSSES